MVHSPARGTTEQSNVNQAEVIAKFQAVLNTMAAMSAVMADPREEKRKEKRRRSQSPSDSEVETTPARGKPNSRSQKSREKTASTRSTSSSGRIASSPVVIDNDDNEGSAD